jgi:23S rRNA maturation-related 3'-5' exoribonuclease YhaM
MEKEVVKLTKKELTVLKGIIRDEIGKIESNPWLTEKQKKEKFKRRFGSG